MERKYIDADKLIAEIKRLHKAHSGKYGCDEVGLNLEYLEDFIDSLQQEMWKPNKEQMRALYSALNDAISQYSNKVSPLYEEVSRTHFEALESLYNDLKKL